MSTEVIILAQGNQSRMGREAGWKQLLPLPLCGGVPILLRTLLQVQSFFPSARVTLVSWARMVTESPNGFAPQWQRALSATRFYELPDPGNSSLKGIARFLENSANDPWREHTIVLLGDVVYSWACLAALAMLSDRCGFAGTSDLSSSGGELWGVAWHQRHLDGMMAELRDSLLRHPPFDDTYQPGQLRRWLVGWRRGDVAEHVTRLSRTGNYLPIDDYTMDVDLPQHIPLLERASRAAAFDDEQHDLVWGGT